MNYRPEKAASKAAALLPLLIIVIVAFGVFSNTLSNSFVYDDSAQVGKNPWIKDFRYLPDIFTSSVWSFESGPVTSNYYRPMMNVMFMIAYHIFGLKSWGFHLVNVLFHTANSVLVFIIAARLLNEEKVRHAVISKETGKDSRFTIHDSRFSAFICALLFAVHPIHVESVAWVSALPEISFTLFSLLSLYYYIRGGAGSARDYLFSVLFFFVAVFYKETALTLPALLIGYDIKFRMDRRFSELWKRYVPYVAVAVGYLAIRIYALGGFAPAKRFTSLSALEYVINVFPLFAQYIQKLFFPINLNAFYVFHPVTSLFGLKFIMSFAATAAFFALAWVSWKRSGAAFFCFLIFAIPLVPVLYIPNLGENAFTERYAYLPSFGFLLFTALLFDVIRKRTTKYSLFLIVAAALLTGIYSLQTLKRNAVWRDPLVFFTDMLEKSPDSAMAQSSMGLILFQRDRTDEAIAHYMQAIRLDPKYAGSYNNLGVIFSDKGMTEKAVQMFEQSIRISPDNAEARVNLGLAYAKMGFRDKAIEQYEMAVQLRPNFAEGHNNLGLAYAETGLIDKAFEQYRIALTLNPEYADAHGNMGAAYAKTGQTDKAIEEFKAAVSWNPGNASLHHNLGLAFFNKGLVNKAVEEFREATRLQPDNAEFFNMLGAAYGEAGLMDKAVENFGKAVQLEPTRSDYSYNLEAALKIKNAGTKRRN